MSANAYAHAYADAYADADADAHANADANANAYADADADANAYAYADAEKQRLNPGMREDDMRDGLYAVALAAGSLTVLRVGWFRRDGHGDDYEVAWCTPFRDGYQTKPSDVWAEGPRAAKGWTFGPVLESTATRLHFVPLARLKPEHWAKVCPKPEGW